MGRPKASLSHPVGGTLAEWAVRRLAEVCPQVVLAGSVASPVAPVLRRVEDGPGRGPAAGILGGARSFPGASLLVLACDLPNVPPELLAALAASTADWALPEVDGRLEPLAALYRPPALAALDRQIVRGDFALHHLRREGELRMQLFHEADLRQFGRPHDLLLNLNTASEVDRWRGLF